MNSTANGYRYIGALGYVQAIAHQAIALLSCLRQKDSTLAFHGHPEATASPASFLGAILVSRWD